MYIHIYIKGRYYIGIWKFNLNFKPLVFKKYFIKFTFRKKDDKILHDFYVLQTPFCKFCESRILPVDRAPNPPTHKRDYKNYKSKQIFN